MKTIPIIPSGAFFPKTADGHLINPCSMELVDKRYHNLLKEITTAYLENEGVNLHSVYLRGSVPRGMCLGKCDLDTFALVFSETDRWRVPKWGAAFQKTWKNKYSFVKETELYLSSYAPVLRSLPHAVTIEGAATNPNLAMILKTQSICLHGKDIRSEIPTYKPDVNMMLAHHWLAADMAAFAKNKKKKAVQQQLLKTIIRSGFELVMPKIQQYTPDLYLCYKSFSEYHPRKEKWMRKALFAFLNPKVTTPEEIEEIVQQLGGWLERRFS